jgi:hypothetical protein
VDRLVREELEPAVINQLFATACYPEYGLPLIVYFAKAHNLDVKSALLANANGGGDNVHRGMVLGILVGATKEEIPQHFKQGLITFDELQTEIEDFSDIALSGTAI